MPIVYIVYFVGVLHLLLGVELDRLLLPFAVYCIWSVMLSVALFYVFRGKKDAQQRRGLAFYGVAFGFLSVSSILIVYFGTRLNLIASRGAHDLYRTICWGLPLVFLVVIIVERIVKRSEAGGRSL